jgi:hypothetical protein
MSIFHNSDIWSCVIDKLPYQEWFAVSLTCNSSNKGLYKYMSLNYGNVNSWCHHIPLFVHKWKCFRQSDAMIETPSYPRAFEDPSSTILATHSFIKNGEKAYIKIDIPTYPLKGVQDYAKMDLTDISEEHIISEDYQDDLSAYEEECPYSY